MKLRHKRCTAPGGAGTLPGMIARNAKARAALLLAACLAGSPAAAADTLFHYRAVAQHSGIETFGQWVRVLERHLTEDVPEGDCRRHTYDRCHLRRWQAFLAGLRGRPLMDQLRAVNRFANRLPYVLDLDNYGVEDYWAVVHEFLDRGGDCEDYVITKFFSLKWLGVPAEHLRVVILQDTNLHAPHAVLAVDVGRTHYILDNQIDQVVTDERIVHYVPVYSINELGWWMYLPPEHG
ncbi:MAG: hypothetical protein D6721_05225 [Gammaproteobacteria bacterium]|nr:MAG: hypothetical protein D6721_05225 [Gammaproteobacteria bacterium]